MKRTIELPDNPLARFREIYDALNAERGFLSDASPLRFAAMSAMSCPGDGAAVARSIREMAEEIKKQSGWFGRFNSPLRFIVGAMLLLHGDTAEAFLAEVKRVGELFRAASLRRGDVYEPMAILVLRMDAGLQPIESATVERFRDIYEEMKRHHWWLTGPDDFPACAILTGRSESPQQIGTTVEEIYQALKSEKFAEGDPLQTAANILYLADVPPREVASRYRALADGFKEAGVSIWSSDYDELAILSFLDHPATLVVERVVEYRTEMETLRPKPDRLLTFNLASSVAFMDLARLDKDLKVVTDAKALMDMQAIINAQQAAAIVACTSATVAATQSQGV